MGQMLKALFLQPVVEEETGDYLVTFELEKEIPFVPTVGAKILTAHPKNPHSWPDVIEDVIWDIREEQFVCWLDDYALSQNEELTQQDAIRDFFQSGWSVLFSEITHFPTLLDAQECIRQLARGLHQPQIVTMFQRLKEDRYFVISELHADLLKWEEQFTKRPRVVFHSLQSEGS